MLSPFSILEKPRQINHVENKETLKSHYTLSLWRLHHGKYPLMISNVEISSKDQEFMIFRDSIYFSHDGHYIFLILLDEYGTFSKICYFSSHDLAIPEIHDQDLTHLNIHGSTIYDTPALLWGHKESLHLDYARQTFNR